MKRSVVATVVPAGVMALVFATLYAAEGSETEPAKRDPEPGR